MSLRTSHFTCSSRIGRGRCPIGWSSSDEHDRFQARRRCPLRADIPPNGTRLGTQHHSGPRVMLRKMHLRRRISRVRQRFSYPHCFGVARSRWHRASNESKFRMSASYLQERGWRIRAVPVGARAIGSWLRASRASPRHDAAANFPGNMQSAHCATSSSLAGHRALPIIILCQIENDCWRPANALPCIGRALSSSWPVVLCTLIVGASLSLD